MVWSNKDLLAFFHGFGNWFPFLLDSETDFHLWRKWKLVSNHKNIYKDSHKTMNSWI